MAIMRDVLLMLFLAVSPLLSATYIFIDEILNKEQREQLFHCILHNEPPRSFYSTNPLDIRSTCARLFPRLHIEWIPPSMWQIAALHAFFHDEAIKKNILACTGKWWDPPEYEEVLHLHLPFARTLEDTAKIFDAHTLSYPGLKDLFFQINKAVTSLYKRSGGTDKEMLRLILSELPPIDQWPSREFPFWKSPSIFDKQSVHLFYRALKDEAFLLNLLQIERTAYENGEWVLYRGYSSSVRLSTLQQNGHGNHALSFGSTLLGGAFFSLDATALTYAESPQPSNPYSFLALKVSPNLLNQIFRIGPLHPFIQLLANGEMFHAHTKIAANHYEEYRTKSLDGYFMKCNEHCSDPVNYIITQKMQPEELEEAFLHLCQKNGRIFSRKAQEN